MKHSFYFTIECNGIIQDINISSTIDPQNFQQILQAVFQLQNNQIIGIMNANNLYDIECFIQNIHKFKNTKFKLLVTPSQKQDPIQQSSYSKDRGQSQQGKRQKNNFNLSLQANSATDYQTRTHSRSQSFIRYLPDNVKFFEDFEFFVKTVQHEKPNTFFLIWFFDSQENLRDYNFNANHFLFSMYPQIEHFCGLYPSFRFRPFGRTDDTFCISFFKGDQLLFERDLDQLTIIPQNVIDLIEESIQNPVPVVLKSKPTTPKSKIIKNRSNSTFSQNQAASLQNQELIFEIIEVISQYFIRNKFSDSDFKEIIKNIRTGHRGIINTYQEFKVTNDETQLLEALKSVLSHSESNLEVSFDKDDSKNFVPNKAQSIKENMFTHTIIENQDSQKLDFSVPNPLIENNWANQNNNNNSINTNYQQNQQNYQQQQSQEINQFNLLNNQIYKIKQILKIDNMKNQLNYEEQAFFVLGILKQDKQFANIFQNLDSKLFFYQYENIRQIKKITQEYAQKIYKNIWSNQVVSIIQSNKNDIFSFVSGALCNLISRGNLQNFQKIINENLYALQQNQNNQGNNIFIQNPQNFPQTHIYNNVNDSPITNSVLNSQQNCNNNEQIFEFPSVANNMDQVPLQQISPTDTLSNSNTCSPENKILNDQDNQISLFSKKKDGDIDSQRQKRKESNFSLRKYQQNPVYSYLARQKKKVSINSSQKSKLTLNSANNNNKSESLQNQERSQKTKMLIQVLDQQITDYINQFNQNLDQEQFDQQYYDVYQQLKNYLNQQQQNILAEIYQTRLPPLISFMENAKQCDEFTYENQEDLKKLIDVYTHFTDLEEYEIPSTEVSPRLKNKISKYKTFKKVLKYLYEIEHFISLQQFHFFHYLYIKENIQSLAAFEVYMVNKDLTDFVENMSQIMKSHFFKKEYQVEDIEQFDQLMEQQFGILFTFKNELNDYQLEALEKTIKLKDNTLLDLYRKYKNNYNREQFLKNLQKYANQRISEFEQFELNQGQTSDEDEEQAENDDEKIETQKNTLVYFHTHKIIKNVGKIQLLLNLIDKKDPRIQGIFETCELTKDRGDFVESLVILYQFEFKKQLKITIESLNLQNNPRYSESYQRHMEKLIQDSHKILFGAFEFYLENLDLDEFQDSVQKVLEYVSN